MMNTYCYNEATGGISSLNSHRVYFDTSRYCDVIEQADGSFICITYERPYVFLFRLTNISFLQNVNIISRKKVLKAIGTENPIKYLIGKMEAFK